MEPLELMELMELMEHMKIKHMAAIKSRFWCKKSGFVAKPVKTFIIRKVNHFH